MGEERTIVKRLKKTQEEKDLMNKVKKDNKERAEKGLAPIFKKKREMKQMKY